MWSKNPKGNESGSDSHESAHTVGDAQRTERLSVAVRLGGVRLETAFLVRLSGHTPPNPSIGHLDPYRFANVQANGFSKVEGDAQLFYSLSETRNVHGADMVMPIAKMAENILRPGEVTTSIDKISWHKPINHHVHIAIAEGPLPAQRDQRTVCDGVLVTNRGRRLAFTAQELPEQIPERMSRGNPFAISAIKNIDTIGTYEYRIHLQSLPDNMMHKLNADRGLLMASAMETVSQGMATMVTNMSSRKMLGLGHTYIRDFENVIVPSRAEMLMRDGAVLRLGLMMSGRRVGRSGMSIIPFAAIGERQEMLARGHVAVFLREK